MKMIKPFSAYSYRSTVAFKRKLPYTFQLLFNTVLEVLQSCDPGLAQEVILIRNDSAYLSDIFAKFDELNLSLERNEINLIKVQ